MVMPMQAVMLAAGRGSRLSGDNEDFLPKSLLRFGGRSLLARHIDCLRRLGIEGLALVVGYRADDILDELAALGAGDFVQPVHNSDYRRGSLLSMWTARDVLAAGRPVLFMDADVLYDAALLRRLVESRHETCLLIDRGFEPGDEPVKLCLKDGRPVEFSKAPQPVDHDTIGEWPGFARLSADFAAALAGTLQRFVDTGRLDAPYEDAIRDLLLSGAAGTAGAEDITGLAWIEIDFPEDLDRARRDVFPRIDGGRETG